MKIVILGGGFGGIYTAQKLLAHRPSDRKLNVTLINRNRYFEFKPLFPEILAGRCPPASARFRLDTLFAKDKCHVQIAEVAGIDLGNRLVKTTKGAVDFDYLVIALGGIPESLPLGQDALSFESLDDCIRLRERVMEVTKTSRGRRARGGRRKSIAVIGGGPTGLEIAFELWHMFNEQPPDTKGVSPVANIFLVSATKRILDGWGQGLRESAEDALANTGINVLTNAWVSRVDKTHVLIKGKRPIFADAVVWAGGLKGLELYQTLGVPLDKKGRFRVNRTLQLPRYRNVYAMGDAINTETFSMPVPQSAQAAYQQASLIATNIGNSIERKPLKEFKYIELGVALPIGGRRAIAHVAGITVDGYTAWALEKALFMYRVPGLENKLKLLDGLMEPLVKKGLRYLERRAPQRVYEIFLE